MQSLGPAKGRLKNKAAALMREANEIGSGNGACARQGRGVRRRSATFQMGFDSLEENRRAVQRFARLCLLRGIDQATRVQSQYPQSAQSPKSAA